ncbi:MAG: polysaccharide biosynthesis C-terminal domain-containing protein [Planctomycetota bacterium]
MSGPFANFVYAPTLAVRVGVRFGAVYLFTRLLTPEGYGRYSLLLTAVAVTQTVLFSWIEAALFRMYARAAKNGWLGDLRASLCGPAAVLAGPVCLAVAVVPFLPQFGESRRALAAGAGLLLTSFASNLRREALRAQGRSGRYTAIDAAGKLGGLTIGVALAWRYDWGAAAPLAGPAFATVLVLLTDLLWERLKRGGELGLGRPRPAIRRAAVAYGVPLALSLGAEALLTSGDRFVIAAFLGESDVGAYAAGYGLAAQGIGMTFTCAGLAAAPLAIEAFERHGAEAARRSAEKFVRVLLFLGVPAAVGLCVVAEPLADFAVGEKLAGDAAVVIRWISPAALLAGLFSQYFTLSFALTRRTGTQAALTATAAGLNLGLNVLLIPSFDLIGAIAATNLAYAFALAAAAIAGRRRLALPFPIGYAARCGTAAAAMAAVLLLAPWPSFISPLAETALRVAAGGTVYLLCAVPLGLAPTIGSNR